MTTVQVRDELDQTPATDDVEPAAAADATEANGQAPDAEATPRKPRRTRASVATAETNGKAHAPEEDEGPVDVLDRAECILKEINAEEAKLLARLDRIRATRRGLGYVEFTLEETAHAQLSARRARSAQETLPAIPAGRAPRARKSGGKRHRRSAEEIAKSVTAVVALVKKHKAGLRAEDIRTRVGLQAKEMPMVLKTAVAGRLLKSKGEKRATTYFAV